MERGSSVELLERKGRAPFGELQQKKKKKKKQRENERRRDHIEVLYKNKEKQGKNREKKRGKRENKGNRKERNNTALSLHPCHLSGFLHSNHSELWMVEVVSESSGMAVNRYLDVWREHIEKFCWRSLLQCMQMSLL